MGIRRSRSRSQLSALKLHLVRSVPSHHSPHSRFVAVSRRNASVSSGTVVVSTAPERRVGRVSAFPQPFHSSLQQATPRPAGSLQQSPPSRQQHRRSRRLHSSRSQSRSRPGRGRSRSGQAPHHVARTSGRSQYHLVRPQSHCRVDPSRSFYRTVSRSHRRTVVRFNGAVVAVLVMVVVFVVVAGHLRVPRPSRSSRPRTRVGQLVKVVVGVVVAGQRRFHRVQG
ncbi:hypothetical protein RRG08_045540 [Elysia crispata]|uniref:Uncharacterized protein n=1 Tax=Elysia crispata TaxID=231223 RepID=A0AAE0ZI67_9GAST|nr:hypothetical protein RRG08_045540 [Elysia crispata]